MCASIVWQAAEKASQMAKRLMLLAIPAHSTAECVS
jgi:hypothetical protein